MASLRAIPVLLLLTSLATAAVASAQTKLIDNGPDGSKMVIVVVGDGYAAGADQTKFINDVDALVVNGIFAHDFFRETQNAFNVYRLDLVSMNSGVTQKVYDEHGTPYDPSDDTVVSRITRNTALKYIYSGSWAHSYFEKSAQTDDLVLKALDAVPGWDRVLVILNQGGQGGVSSGRSIVVTRAEPWSVFTHELGHGLGGLLDEASHNDTHYTGSVNGPNCTTSLDRNTIHWKRFISADTALPTVGFRDATRTIGAFEGCAYRETGIYRPAGNCRMRTGGEQWLGLCTVCETHMKRILYPFLDHDFSHVVGGDFNGDGRSDVLIHNGADLEIRLGDVRPPLRPLWVGNNVVPAATGGATWEPRAHDQYFVADFSGDGSDDVIAFNGLDWTWPRVGLLKSTNNALGLACVARYGEWLGGEGMWRLTAGDQLATGDFDGDGKKDLFIKNDDYPLTSRYAAVFRSTGTALSPVRRYIGNLPPAAPNLPGWTLRPGDRAHVGDFDGDGQDDVYMVNTTVNPPALGMLRANGAAQLSAVKVFQGGIVAKPGDQYYVGDFNGDHRQDLYIFNGTALPPTHLMMVESTGSDLRYVNLYYTGAATTVPGWGLGRGDRLFVADPNGDGKDDLLAFNTTNWGTEFLSALISSGTALRAVPFSVDWVGGWNLGDDDQLLVANARGAARTRSVFIHNDEWFGQLRWTSQGFALDRIHYHWLSNALHDSKPWSDSMP